MKMSLEIVIGPMFSGKSTYALSYVRRYRAIDKSVQIVKPRIDSRYTNDHVMISHDREQIPCLVWDIQTPFYLDNFINYDCIVIEEAQFFRGLRSLVKELLFVYKKHILLVGLDGDSSQEPFGELLECIPMSTKLVKLHSYCSLCKDGTPASYTKRINQENMLDQVCVGGAEMYKSVCLKHL